MSQQYEYLRSEIVVRCDSLQVIKCRGQMRVWFLERDSWIGPSMYILYIGRILHVRRAGTRTTQRVLNSKWEACHAGDQI